MPRHVCLSKGASCKLLATNVWVMLLCLVFIEEFPGYFLTPALAVLIFSRIIDKQVYGDEDIKNPDTTSTDLILIHV